MLVIRGGSQAGGRPSYVIPSWSGGTSLQLRESSMQQLQYEPFAGLTATGLAAKELTKLKQVGIRCSCLGLSGKGDTHKPTCSKSLAQHISPKGGTVVWLCNAVRRFVVYAVLPFKREAGQLYRNDGVGRCRSAPKMIFTGSRFLRLGTSVVTLFAGNIFPHSSWRYCLQYPKTAILQVAGKLMLDPCALPFRQVLLVAASDSAPHAIGTPQFFIADACSSNWF